jgi:hypothetical protein
MLLTLLTGTSSATFFAAAVVAARHAKAGLGGYALAIIIGLFLAVCNAWILYKLGDILAGLTRSHSEAQQNRWGRAAFVAMVLWLPVAAFLGDWVASAAMRLVVRGG